MKIREEREKTDKLPQMKNVFYCFTTLLSDNKSEKKTNYLHYRDNEFSAIKFLFSLASEEKENVEMF